MQWVQAYDRNLKFLKFQQLLKHILTVSRGNRTPGSCVATPVATRVAKLNIAIHSN